MHTGDIGLRAETGSRVTGSPGHRVNNYVRVGSGLGSILLTQFQLSDRAYIICCLLPMFLYFSHA